MENNQLIKATRAIMHDPNQYVSPRSAVARCLADWPATTRIEKDLLEGARHLILSRGGSAQAARRLINFDQQLDSLLRDLSSILSSHPTPAPAPVRFCKYCHRIFSRRRELCAECSSSPATRKKAQRTYQAFVNNLSHTMKLSTSQLLRHQSVSGILNPGSREILATWLFNELNAWDCRKTKIRASMRGVWTDAWTWYYQPSITPQLAHDMLARFVARAEAEAASPGPGRPPTIDIDKVKAIVANHGGNQAAAARSIGVTRQALSKALAKL